MSTLKQKLKSVLLQTLWAFGPDELVRAIRRLGVREGDVLMVHSGWRPGSGFRGRPQDLVQAFLDAVGPTGTLCMMSMPFHGTSAAEYLTTGKVFDVRRTVSMVGLPSEIFRRRKGAVRSLHPTHSVAAMGPRASWLTEGHERCRSPFGPGSPFDKLVEAGAKILLYDVSFSFMTFEHYLEDRIQARLPVPLYEPEERPAEVIDSQGERRSVATQVLSAAVNRGRNSAALGAWLEAGGLLRRTTFKNVRLSLVDAKGAAERLDRTSGLPTGWHESESGQ